MPKKIDYYNSPRWSFEFPDCSMPVTFDQYNNCAFTCLYCFATFQRAMTSEDHILKNNLKHVNVDKVKRLFNLQTKSGFNDYIKARKVLQWGGMSDPFCYFERNNGIGLKLLRFFREIDYPICFSTKGTWWLDDERYTELFKDNPNWNVKVSIITIDEKKARYVEKGVPSPQKRLRALKKITDLNCGGATLRLRPFMIGISTPKHLELITEAANNGATALSTEFFCLDLRSRVLKERLKTISKLAGFDYTTYYKKYSSGQGYLRLNRNVKRKYVYEMKDLCEELGVRFYVSDAHFKENCNNGCCCGLSTDWNYSRGQYTNALVICKAKGEVRWEDISDEMDHFENVPFYGTMNLPERKLANFKFLTIKEYLRYMWNHPMEGHSPYKMFEGIMKPSGVDNDQNVIYVYDKKRE